MKILVGEIKEIKDIKFEVEMIRSTIMFKGAGLGFIIKVVGNNDNPITNYCWQIDKEVPESFIKQMGKGLNYILEDLEKYINERN